MIKLFYLNQEINLKYGLNALTFENPTMFRQMYYNLFENIKLLDGIVECQSSKIIIIKDVLNVSINEKKNLTYLFKLTNVILKEKYETDYLKIVTMLKNLLVNITDSMDLDVEFEEVDTTKLFQSFNLKYQEDNLSYLESIISYISIINTITSPKVFITYNLLNYLTEEEYNSLQQEFAIKQIVLLDISLNLIKNKCQNLFNVDDEYCIM